MTQAKNKQDYGETLKGTLHRVKSYLSHFQWFFFNRTKSSFLIARKYVEGLLGLTFMMEVHKDQHVFLEKPDLVLPEKRSNKGRKPKRLQSDISSIRVDEYCNELREEAWQSLKVRNTAKGYKQSSQKASELNVLNRII